MNNNECTCGNALRTCGGSCPCLPRLDPRTAWAAWAACADPGGPLRDSPLPAGVFQGPGSNCDVDTAKVAVDDVSAAVGAALHHTRNLRWHSMR